VAAEEEDSKGTAATPEVRPVVAAENLEREVPADSRRAAAVAVDSRQTARMAIPTAALAAGHKAVPAALTAPAGTQQVI
jgi:hypothetical protein